MCQVNTAPSDTVQRYRPSSLHAMSCAHANQACACAWICHILGARHVGCWRMCAPAAPHARAHKSACVHEQPLMREHTKAHVRTSSPSCESTQKHVCAPAAPHARAHKARVGTCPRVNSVLALANSVSMHTPLSRVCKHMPLLKVCKCMPLSKMREHVPLSQIKCALKQSKGKVCQGTRPGTRPEVGRKTGKRGRQKTKSGRRQKRHRGRA